MRPIPVSDPVAFESFAAHALATTGWFARLGHEPHFPLSTAQAVELLVKGGEYRLDQHQLSELASRGVITAPEDGLWTAGDIVQAGAVLEARRQWQVTPSLHDPKKHPAMIRLEEMAAADNLDEALAGEPALDARHYAILLTEADNREIREKLLPGLLGSLEKEFGARL